TADQLGGELAPVEQAHDDFTGAADHVEVGQDVAVVGQDEARTERLLFRWIPVRQLAFRSERLRMLVEKAPEPLRDVLEGLRLDLLSGSASPRRLRRHRADVDHRRRYTLDQVSEVGVRPGGGRYPAPAGSQDEKT